MPRAIFLTTVKVREKPSTSSKYFDSYSAGQTVNYDSTVENEGRLWISYIGGSGNRRYCCARDDDGEWLINLGGGGGNNFGESNNEFTCFNQKNSRHNAVKKEGCCFLCCCFLGGLNDLEECDDCFPWAVNNGYVRSDSFVQGRDRLINKLANKYGRSCRSGEIVEGNGHFYVEDGNKKEIFNSIKKGYGH